MADPKATNEPVDITVNGKAIPVTESGKALTGSISLGGTAALDFSLNHFWLYELGGTAGLEFWLSQFWLCQYKCMGTASASAYPL